MLFVNEIGEIIHGIVDRYSGAANKNIGDAFLLVWKFESDMQAIDKKNWRTIRQRKLQGCSVSRHECDILPFVHS